jgi:hypothetical protein
MAESTAESLLAELVAVMRSLVAEVQGLRADVRATTRRGEFPIPQVHIVRLYAAIEHALTQTATDEFATAEVIAHGKVDHELSEALRVCRACHTDTLGRLFRSLRDREIGGWRLVRDGDGWRLPRT